MQTESMQTEVRSDGASANPTTVADDGLAALDVEAFLKIAGNLYDTQSVFALQTRLLASPKRAEMVAHMQAQITGDAGFMELYRERYIPRFLTNDELLEFPNGTLGHALGVHLSSNGIQLDFAGLDTGVFYNVEMTPTGYLSVRGIRTHDIYHTVLGLGVTPTEEIALFFFQLAMFGSPLHMIGVAAGFLNVTLHRTHEVMHFLAEAHRLYAIGLKAKANGFLGFRFEEHFATPIEDVRRMCGVSGWNA